MQNKSLQIQRAISDSGTNALMSNGADAHGIGAMAQIIRIEEFHGVRRRQHPARRASDSEEQQPRLYCTRCRCQSFSLLLSGEVLCVNCGAKIRNVQVAMEKPATAQDQ